MRFNDHSRIAGQHALLSASKYSWVNYDVDKLEQFFRNAEAAKRGTELHALASQMIKLGVRPRKSKQTLNMFVNDAISYRMASEQPLFYSVNCFGTPDAISYRRNALRISDLKTGATTASFKQLIIYAAMFCLEYGVNPRDILIELRIYQNDDVALYEADAEEVLYVMGKIIEFDARIEALKEEAAL